MLILLSFRPANRLSTYDTNCEIYKQTNREKVSIPKTGSNSSYKVPHVRKRSTGNRTKNTLPATTMLQAAIMRHSCRHHNDACPQSRNELATGIGRYLVTNQGKHLPYSPVYSTHFFVSVLVLKTRMRTIFGCVLSMGSFCCFGEKGKFTRELTIQG